MLLAAFYEENLYNFDEWEAYKGNSIIFFELIKCQKNERFFFK